MTSSSLKEDNNDTTAEEEDRGGYSEQMDCGPTQCTYITCRVGPLKKKEFVVFRIRSRLWSSTLAKLTSLNQYEISSRMVAQVLELPHKVDPGFLGLKTYTVTTRVLSLHDFGEGKGVPIWILLLAILAGLIFLAILSFCLWHFGFFRRSRPDTAHSATASDTAATPQEGVVLLHEKQPSAKVAQTSFAGVAKAANGASNGYGNHDHHHQHYRSMPGNSASIYSMRNSGRMNGGAVGGGGDYQSLLPYPEGILQPGDEAL